MLSLPLRYSVMEMSRNLDAEQFRMLIEALYGYFKNGSIIDIPPDEPLVNTIFKYEMSYIDFHKKQYDEGTRKNKAKEKGRKKKKDVEN